MKASQLQVSPAADRNKGPLLARLKEILPDQCRILEIASGTGQHAAFFTAEQPNWIWQPTDMNASALASIQTYQKRSQRPNFLAPLQLDVLGPWPEESFEAVFNANMIHIAPWACCQALFEGAEKIVEPDGKLLLYGPFVQNGVVTAPSNQSFDVSLRQRDPDWGIRNLEDVVRVAQRHGFKLMQNFQMPANNRLVFFAKRASAIG